MMDALSANPTQFGSMVSPNASQGMDNMNGAGFAMGMMFGHNSPGSDPFDKVGMGNAGGSPFLIEIDQHGQAHTISGSLLDTPDFLGPLFDSSLVHPLRFYDMPGFRSKISTCFAAQPAGTGGGTLTNAANYFVPAGFNYGYSHGLPTPPSYHFNRRHYGYFSDMVETPGETALVVGTAGKQSGAVRCRFISRGGTSNVDPETTNSQNLSTFCTSSTPYDEGPGNLRDRKTLQPDLQDVITFQESIELNLDE